MLRKITALKIINLLLVLSLGIQASSGLTHGVLSRELFEWLHERNGILLVVLIVLHLGLNWSWVKTNYFKWL